MHLTWEVSIGQVVVSVPIFWLLFYMARIYGMLIMFRIEHEILMAEWGAKQVPPKRLQDLPWRQKRWF